jgi:hypothetical protein
MKAFTEGIIKLCGARSLRLDLFQSAAPKDGERTGSRQAIQSRACPLKASRGWQNGKRRGAALWSGGGEECFAIKFQRRR